MKSAIYTCLMILSLTLIIFPYTINAQSRSIETFSDGHVSIIDITNTDRVWVGTTNVGCAALISGAWSTFDSTNTPMPSDDVTAICIYGIAGVPHSFMGTARGVAYKFGTTWDSLSSLPNLQVTGITKSLNDSLWVSTGAGVSLYNGSTLQHLYDYTTANSSLPDSNISCMQSNISNSLGYAAGTPAHGMFYTTDGSTFTPVTMATASLVSDSINCIYVASGGGTYYIGTREGLSIYTTSCSNYTTVQGLPGNDITTLTMDCQNRLWIGTRNNGLSVYNGTTFHNINTSNGLPTNQITSISCDTACSCWIGTPDNGIIVIDSSLTQLTPVNLPTGITAPDPDATVHIYPQPASSLVTFSLPPSSGRWTLSVTDMSGRLVLNGGVFAADGTVNIEGLQSGMYIYGISTDGVQQYHGKLLIAR